MTADMISAIDNNNDDDDSINKAFRQICWIAPEMAVESKSVLPLAFDLGLAWDDE